MKRLEIPGGGMPFTGDDLLWMGDGIYEAILMLAKKYAESYDESGRGVVTGLALSVGGGNITLGNGWLILDGHLCYCNGWTGSGELHNYELYYDPIYDPDGNDVFADSVSRDTYKIQRASVRPSTIAVDNQPGILRLSIIDDIRVSIRFNSSRTIYINLARTKAILEEYGKFRTVTILIGSDAPPGNLFSIAPKDRPNGALLSRQTPLFSTSGIFKGVLTFDPIGGGVAFSGNLPTAGEPSLFCNFTWMI